jgi:hypothetical protein
MTSRAHTTLLDALAFNIARASEKALIEKLTAARERLQQQYDNDHRGPALIDRISWERDR